MGFNVYSLLADRTVFLLLLKYRVSFYTYVVDFRNRFIHVHIKC